MNHAQRLGLRASQAHRAPSDDDEIAVIVHLRRRGQLRAAGRGRAATTRTRPSSPLRRSAAAPCPTRAAAHSAAQARSPRRRGCAPPTVDAFSITHTRMSGELLQADGERQFRGTSAHGDHVVFHDIAFASWRGSLGWLAAEWPVFRVIAWGNWRLRTWLAAAGRRSQNRRPALPRHLPALGSRVRWRRQRMLRVSGPTVAAKQCLPLAGRSFPLAWRRAGYFCGQREVTKKTALHRRFAHHRVRKSPWCSPANGRRITPPSLRSDRFAFPPQPPALLGAVEGDRQGARSCAPLPKHRNNAASPWLEARRSARRCPGACAARAAGETPQGAPRRRARSLRVQERALNEPAGRPRRRWTGVH